VVTVAAREGTRAMPRYVFATAPTSQAAADWAMRLVSRRFPELEIEHRTTMEGEAAAHDTWVCHAPNESHVLRWAIAAGLELFDVVPNDSARVIAPRLPALAINQRGTDQTVDPTRRNGAHP
jgi:hypothetical protein